jgi:hypothetical protein
VEHLLIELHGRRASRSSSARATTLRHLGRVLGRCSLLDGSMM